LGVTPPESFHSLRRALTDAIRTFVRGVIPPSSPPRVRNAAFALFIAGILAYGAALSAHMLAKFDLVNLIRDVSFDDSFYYFQIAANLAEGKFSTFDGGITRTNGYHPLWLFLITPFYWVLDKETALFGIKAFEIMLVAGAVALIAAAARLARLPWILLFALLPTLYQHRALFLGLEAAAALFMLALLFLALTLYARNPARAQNSGCTKGARVAESAAQVEGARDFPAARTPPPEARRISPALQSCASRSRRPAHRRGARTPAPAASSRPAPGSRRRRGR